MRDTETGDRPERPIPDGGTDRPETETEAETDGRVPVTVVSGSLGAGKTTLINRVLNARDGPSVAVIVNDMGEVNIDAELIAEETDDGVVDLSNGCICCRLQDDLLTEAARLADRRAFDYLLVEASGISEPIPVARTFAVGSDTSEVDPTERFRLDTTVTVVDAFGFWKEFDAEEPLPASADPERPLADILVEGIEFCDVLLLNKRDLVPDDAFEEVEAVVRELQPRAALYATTHCDIPPDAVLGTGRFDFERASREVGWKRHLAGGTATGAADGERRSHGHDHGDAESAAERHGVTSVVYERDRPFHPGRFADWLEEWRGDVVRAKGFFLLAGREGDVMGLDRAGPSVRAGPIGQWDESDAPETRLVFIGRELDGESLAAELDECLATDRERDETLPDRFPMESVADGER